MTADLTIRVRREPGCAIVTVAGEIDIATVARLRQCLNKLVDSAQPVVADLDQVDFMDASGLGAIVGAARRAAACGTTLQVVCDRRQTRRLFHLAGLDGQIRLARTLAEALQTLEGDRPTQG